MSKRKLHKINEEIYVPNVRITGDDIESRIVTRQEALEIAISMAKDMILISENANPPVVKIEDYQKFLYKQEQNKKNSKGDKSELKEIGLSPFIGDNDLNVKIKKAIEFLEEGHKVKLNLTLKNREKARPEQGELVVLKFLDAVKEQGVPETMPKYENSKWFCLIKPKK